MQFRVPQFIDIEDKLFGPFTFKQFVYLVGGAGIIYVLYKILPLWLAIIPIIFIAGLAGLLAFYKINNKPFAYYLQAGLGYFVSSKLYVWKQRLVKSNDKNKEDETLPEQVSILPKVSVDSIKDLSWSLDIEDKK
jgi:hypothetical protein